MQEIRVWSLSGEDPLEQEMATHSSILAWKIPWTEEPGRLQSMGSQRVRHDWVTEQVHMHLKQGFPDSTLGKLLLCFLGYPMHISHIYMHICYIYTLFQWLCYRYSGEYWLPLRRTQFLWWSHCINILSQCHVIHMCNRVCIHEIYWNN